MEGEGGRRGEEKERRGGKCEEGSKERREWRKRWKRKVSGREKRKGRRYERE